LAFYTYGVSIVIIPVFLVLYFGLVGLGRVYEKHVEGTEHGERATDALKRVPTRDIRPAEAGAGRYRCPAWQVGSPTTNSYTRLGALWRNQGKTWRSKLGVVGSLLIFFLVASPFFMFIGDNYILHTTPWIVQHLPLTIPLLIASRLAQVASGENALAANAQFLLSGFHDGAIWNMADGYSAFGLVSLPLVAIGIYYSIRRRQVHANLFLIWLLATIPMFFLFPLNIYRANAMYLPFIALSAIGVNGLYDSIDKKDMKMVMVSVILVAFTLYNSLFCFYYFTTYNNDIQDAFSDGFDAALMQARFVAYPNEPMYVSNWITFNYVYTLFYLKADPLDFQKHARVIASGGIYQVRNYRNYYFSPNDTRLTSAPSFVAILKGNELPYCGYRVILYSEKDWTVVRCFNR